MVETRRARAEELPRLKELWKTAFGDGEVFLERFFREYAAPEQVLTLCEDGAPAAMLVLLPQTLTAEGKGEALPYIYALTTRPDCRGKGYAGRLMEYAGELARAQGADKISTVPAQESLHRFFGGEGFREGFVTWEGTFSVEELPPAEGKAEPVTAEEYGALREEILEKLPHLSYPETQLRLQEMICHMSGGGLYRLEIAGRKGCAAVEVLDEGAVLAKELLCPGGALAGAGRLAKLLPAKRYVIRTPAAWAGANGELRRFGMVKSLRTGEKLTIPEDGWYLGLAFD